MPANRGDKRLSVQVRQVRGGWEMRQTWSKVPEFRVWRSIPDFPGIAQFREAIEENGYRVEVVK